MAEQVAKEKIRWLLKEAERCIKESRCLAFDGTPVYQLEPKVYAGALWVEDFWMIVHGCPETIPPEEIRAGYEYILNYQTKDGIIPDRVTTYGTPEYLVNGKLPPAYNPQYMVKLAYEYYKITNDLSLFERSRAKLSKALETLPRNKDTHCVWIDPDCPHSAFGFTDSICKTGDQLFSSLLLWEADLQMAEMLEGLNKNKEVREFREDAEKIYTGIRKLWNEEWGFFKAASLTCSQPDVWGSSYAVHTGFTDKNQTLSISHWLIDNYSKIVKRGQIKHLPEPMVWEKTFDTGKPSWTAPGAYQNGAYWGTPTGWIADAISKTDLSLAQRLIIEMIDDYQNNGVYECINDGYQKCCGYLPSLALPCEFARTLL